MGRHFYITDTDRTIAKRIRLRRIMLGMSQSDLAKLCGVSFQQIQKYEASVNKMSVSRLYQISKVLKMPVECFFENSNRKYDTKSLELLVLYWKLPKNIRKTLVLDWIKHIN